MYSPAIQGLLVQARIERNPHSPAWDRMDDAWLHVVAHAKGILAAEKRGRAASAISA